MKYIFLGFILIFIISVFLYTSRGLYTPSQKLTVVNVAMDWTPNTNHTGIYVAMAKGWYTAQGLHVNLLPYSPTVSSDVLVANGKADVGISATEGVVTDAAAGFPVVSIGAIIQHNTSSLAALANNGITRPRDFDSKVYGGFGAPYENAVISEIIRKDGGTGNFKNVTLDIDGIQALETHKIDFVWIFDGWTGIQAKQQGIHLISFPINSHGIADYYTPVFIASPKEINSHPLVLKKFMKATSQGYTYAITHPQQSAQILLNSVPKGTFTNSQFIIASQRFLSAHYVDPGRKWGLQDRKAWHLYPQFMLDSHAILTNSGKPVTRLPLDSLYTNTFLP